MKMGEYLDRAATSNPMIRGIISMRSNGIDQKSQKVTESHRDSAQIRLDEIRLDEKREERECAGAQEPPPPSKNPDLKIIPRPGLSTALGSEIVEAWRIMPEAIPKPYGAAGMELLSDDLRRALEAIRSKRITSGDALECIKNYRATANGEAGETWVKIWLGLAKFFETDFWQNFLPNRWPDAVKKLQEKPKPEIDWTELEKEAKRLEGLK